MAEEVHSRVELCASEIECLSADLLNKWRAMEAFADRLEKKTASLEADLTGARANEEKLRTQLNEATHRDRVYSRRLAHKDHEIQDLLAQIAELKNNSAPGPAGLRAALLDPAVNLVIARLRAEVIAHKTRLEETQSELSAWKFTPDSNTGKRLMAKCRLLYQENEELGRVVSSGRLAKLEGDLALQKRFSEEVKKSQSELDEFLQDLDEDVEGMQGTIYFLQQELRKIKEVERTESRVQNGECERTDGDVERTLSDEGEGEGESHGDGHGHGVPVTKKPRRDSSDLSMEYREQPQLGLTNGDIKEEMC